MHVIIIIVAIKQWVKITHAQQGNISPNVFNAKNRSIIWPLSSAKENKNIKL